MTAPDDPNNPGPGYGAPPPPGYGGPPPPSYGGAPPPGYSAPPPGYGPPPGYPPPGYGPPRRNNDKALLSMILGIVSMVSCGMLLGIPALILGNKAKREIASSGEEGDGMATAGIVLGWISTILSGLVVLVYAVILVVALISASS